jgi:hypothetical protein
MPGYQGDGALETEVGLVMRSMMSVCNTVSIDASGHQIAGLIRSSSRLASSKSMAADQPADPSF